MTQNSDHPGDYWSNSSPDFGLINTWATVHLTWAGWVHHSLRFGHAVAVRELGLEIPVRGSKTSKLPVVWANLEFFRLDTNNFLSRLVTMEVTWLYHYDRRQSNKQWSGGISAHPAPPQKLPSTQIRLESSRFDFLRSRRHPPHSISSKEPNHWRGVLLISAGANEGHLKKCISAGRSQRGPVLERQCPVSTGTCNLEETGLPGLQISWSRNIFSGSGPVGIPTFPWT